jgi:cyclase
MRKKKYDKPFDLLINTHHHGNHSGGNVAFKGLVKHVVAHQNSALNQKRVFEEAQKAGRKTTEYLFLDMTFETKWKYKAGDQKVVVYYFGAGHTNGDAMTYFVDENVVHMGDLVFNRRFPFIDRSSGANIASWIKVLDLAINKFGSKTQYVFGHALDPEKIVGTVDDVKAFQNYLQKLLAYVSQEMKAEKTKEEMMKATFIPGAEEWKGSGAGRGIEAAYEELS